MRPIHLLSSSLLVVATVAGGACTFDAAVPGDAVIGCARSADCPDGQSCNAFIGRCAPREVLEAEPPSLTSSSLAPQAGGLDTTFLVTLAFSEPLADDPEVEVDVGGTTRAFTIDEAASDRAAGSFVLAWSPTTADAEGTWPVRAAWTGEGGARVEPSQVGAVTLDFSASVEDGVAAVTTSSVTPAAGNLDTVFTVEVAFDGPLGADPVVSVLVDGTPRPLLVDDAGTDRAASTWRFLYAPSSSDAEGVWPVQVSWTSLAGAAAGPEVIGAITLDYAGAVIAAQVAPSVVGAGGSATLTVTASEPLAAAPALLFEGGNDPGFVLESADDTLFIFTVDVTCAPLCTVPDGTYRLTAVAVEDLVGNTRTIPVTGATLDVDTKAPRVQQLTTNRAVYGASAGFNDIVITFSVDELVGDGDVEATFGGELLSCGPRQAARPQFTCTGTVDLGFVEGPAAVVASVIDGAGNAGAATVTVATDFTPPAVLEGSVALDLIGAPGAISAPTFASFGTRVVVTFGVDEPLREVPSVVLLDAATPPGLPAGLELPLDVTLDALRFATGEALLENELPDDTYAARATLVDLAGNTALVDLPVSFPFRATVSSPCVVPSGACTDFDADGQLGASPTCPGFTDCDDTNPLVHLGGLEIPGDGLDNDCGGDGDLAPDDTNGVFVDPAAGNDGNPGTRALPRRTIPTSSGLDYVFVARGVTSIGANVNDPDLSVIGGYDPATWTLSEDRTTFQGTVNGTLAAVVNVNAVTFVAAPQLLLARSDVASINTAPVRTVGAVSQFFGVTRSGDLFVSQSRLATVFVSGSGANVSFDRVDVGVGGVLGFSPGGASVNVTVTNSVVRGRIDTVRGEVRLIHSGWLDIDDSALIVEGRLALVNTWVQAPTIQIDAFLGRVRLRNVAWAASVSGSRVLGLGLDPGGLSALNGTPSPPAADESTGNVVATDVQTFDGLHLLPTSPVLGLATDASDLTTVIGGDIDGECRGAIGDIGADELP